MPINSSVIFYFPPIPGSGPIFRCRNKSNAHTLSVIHFIIDYPQFGLTVQPVDSPAALDSEEIVGGGYIEIFSSVGGSKIQATFPLNGETDKSPLIFRSNIEMNPWHLVWVVETGKFKIEFNYAMQAPGGCQSLHLFISHGLL